MGSETACPWLDCATGTDRFEVGRGALAPPARKILSQLTLYAAQQGMEAPKVISACRTYDEQLELQQRWDRGDREGIHTRPANPENSRHVADESGLCWAFDVGNSHEWCKVMGPYIQRINPDAIWGGSWLTPDLPHFEAKRWKLAAAVRLV